MQNTTVVKKIPEINKNQLSPRRSIKRKRKTTNQQNETHTRKKLIKDYLKST